MSESSAITQTVLAQAQAEQHQYFMTTGRFDNEVRASSGIGSESAG